MTFIYQTLIHHFHGQGKIALACAISGVAATLLPGGTTAHSLFGLPIDMPDHDATSSIKAQDGRAEVLRRASIIVWDEASMVPLAALDCVDRLLRDLLGNNIPFGGKIIVMGGDFRQILPVVPRGGEAEVVSRTILQHYAMRDGTFRKFTLTENMRLRLSGGEDASHRDWLLELGVGNVPYVDSLHPHAISLPNHLCMPAGASPNSFIEWFSPPSAVMRMSV